MKLYNTLTRKKEEFIPLEKGKVKMYVCGPTVYNYIHIGNARPIIVFDTVRRYFEYKGYDVNFVTNYTDIDDKIIKRAQDENVSATDISERFIQEFLRDTEALNINPATCNPKVTEEIDGTIDLIQTLIDKGYAYNKNGTVYFSTRKFEGYGKLSKRNIDELRSGSRISVDDEKEDPLDFVLWKPKKEGEPAWSSPWSEGRPGWHIECSVMSKKYLGDQIDIHAGGEDLIFPHHENEIAQSEAATGKQFAKYWMHNAFLNIDNKKMSKSDGNFFTVREISEKYDLQILRFFMLSAHYRSPINFSQDLMEAAKKGLDRILTAYGQLEELLQGKEESILRQDEEKIMEEIDQLHKQYEEAMDDDFNTADAISFIFEIVRLANSHANKDSSRELIGKIKGKLDLLCGIIGIETKIEKGLLDEDIEKLIEERNQARKNKDFQRSDEIRDLLIDKGILLEDTREGVRWKRK